MIERELGRGGMGVVYQAWQPQLARRVAIKVVSAGIGVGAEDRRRWLREARAIGRVRHRNVVRSTTRASRTAASTSSST